MKCYCCACGSPIEVADPAKESRAVCPACGWSAPMADLIAPVGAEPAASPMAGSPPPDRPRSRVGLLIASGVVVFLLLLLLLLLLPDCRGKRVVFGPLGKTDSTQPAPPPAQPATNPEPQRPVLPAVPPGRQTPVEAASAIPASPDRGGLPRGSDGRPGLPDPARSGTGVTGIGSGGGVGTASPGASPAPREAGARGNSQPPLAGSDAGRGGGSAQSQAPSEPKSISAPAPQSDPLRPVPTNDVRSATTGLAHGSSPPPIAEQARDSDKQELEKLKEKELRKIQREKEAQAEAEKAAQVTGLTKVKPQEPEPAKPQESAKTAEPATAPSQPGEGQKGIGGPGPGAPVQAGQVSGAGGAGQGKGGGTGPPQSPAPGQTASSAPPAARPAEEPTQIASSQPEAESRALAGGGGADKRKKPSARRPFEDPESTNVVYLLDRSLSMKGNRSQAARRELVHALEGLGTNKAFYVMFYDSTGYAAMPVTNPLPASPQNVQSMTNWIYSVDHRYGSDPTKAVHDALKLNPDTIWLLSDGQFGGSVPRAIRKDNAAQKAKINTIGFHTRDGEAMLQKIAEDNRGAYQYVPPPEGAGTNYVAPRADPFSRKGGSLLLNK